MKRWVIGLFFMAGSWLSAETIVLSTGEWAPYVSETLEGYGPAGRVVTEACERAGLKCEFEFMPWKRAWIVAKKGAVPATFLWSYSQEREEEMYASSSTVGKSETVVFYLKSKMPNGMGISKWEDVKGKKYVGVRGYYQTQQSEKFGADVHKVNSADVALKFLAAGKADFTIEDPMVAAVNAQNFIPQLASDLTREKTALETTPMHIFYSRTSDAGKQLKEKLDPILEKMHQDGTIKKIYDSVK